MHPQILSPWKAVWYSYSVQFVTEVAASDVSTSHHQSILPSCIRILTIFDTIWATLVSSYSNLSQKSHRNNPGAANETGLLQLQVRHQVDRLLTERTWGKGKRSKTYFYNFTINLFSTHYHRKLRRHWPVYEYWFHEAAAVYIDDIKKVVERLLRQTVWHLSIWTSHTQGQESVSGEWQETFLFSWYRQIQKMTQGIVSL